MSDAVLAAVIGAGALLVAAIIAGGFQLVSGRQQRTQENRTARRNRLGPRYRELIGICEDMRATAYRLQADAPLEVNVNRGAIPEYRRRLNQIVEPDLRKPYRDVDAVLTALTTWWGRALAVAQIDAQGQDVNPKIRDAIDSLGETVQANLNRIHGELEVDLAKLEA